MWFCFGTWSMEMGEIGSLLLMNVPKRFSLLNDSGTMLAWTSVHNITQVYFLHVYANSYKQTSRHYTEVSHQEQRLCKSKMPCMYQPLVLMLCWLCVDLAVNWRPDMLPHWHHHQVMCCQNVCEMPGKQAIYWYFLSGIFMEHPLLDWQNLNLSEFFWVTRETSSWVHVGATDMMQGNGFERCIWVPTMQWCVQNQVQVSSIIPQLDWFAWSLKKIFSCVNRNGFFKKAFIQGQYCATQAFSHCLFYGTSSTFPPVKMTDTFVSFLSSHQCKGHSVKHETPYLLMTGRLYLYPHASPDVVSARAKGLSGYNMCFTWCLMKSKICDYWKQKLHFFGKK